MVGRDAELHQLVGAFHRARVVVVTGAAGSGKTTLVDAFARKWGDVPVVEDVHALDRERRRELLHRLARLDGCSLVTTRERLWLPDGAEELWLHGLSRADARATWAELDAREGESDAFEEAFEQCGGHPGHLRWAHAGSYGFDPLACAVAELDGPARRVLGALALAGFRMDLEELGEMVHDRGVLSVVRDLWMKLFIRVDGAGTCTLEPFYRRFVERLLSDEARREMGETLARLRPEGAERSGPALRSLSLLAERIAEILDDDPVIGVASLPGGVTYDPHAHELRAGNRRTSLRARPVLRKLLQVLAMSGNQMVDREALTLAVWGRPYNPIVHDGVVRVNVSTLRKIVAPFGLRIDFDESGYRLIAPDGISIDPVLFAAP